LGRSVAEGAACANNPSPKRAEKIIVFIGRFLF